jgi:DNA-binding NtrC family response regulator
MPDNINLLVIDDNVEQCKILKNILDKNGYFTQTASRSKEALLLIKKMQFDLILIDLVIKGDLNGVEIFRAMKKIRPDVKAIFITGHGPQEELDLILEAMKEGMIDEILRKPIAPADLIKAIEKNIGGKKNEQ